jgi:ABC-type antimicrobial peptide transport system permease subunit
MMVVVQYRDRMETYLKEYTPMKMDMMWWTNGISDALGLDFEAEFQLPLVKTLYGVSYLRMFLDQIFNSTTVILVGLGIMLIFSLLLSDVEEKTYEYGMLRALGLEHNSLMSLLLVQSVFYALPGIALGLLLALLLSVPIELLIAEYSSTGATFGLASSAVWMGSVLGLTMPMVANVVPIKRALSRTLRDALDVYHSAASDTKVRTVDLEKLGLSAWQTAASIMMVLVGFVVYYVIPYSFLAGNLPLFLGILNTILLGMVLGAAMIATIVQPRLERAVLWAMLWGRDRPLGDLVRKGLSGHRTRNRKTALMFTTSLAFIIFAGAMFTLQAASINNNVELLLGSDVVVISYRYEHALDEQAMRAFLDAELDAAGHRRVRDYAFVTFPLRINRRVSAAQIGNLAHFPNVRVLLFGVERSYLNAVYEQFFMPTEVADGIDYAPLRESRGKPDIVRSLYADAGAQRLPIEHVVAAAGDRGNNGHGDDNAAVAVPPPLYSEQADVLVDDALSSTLASSTSVSSASAASRTWRSSRAVYTRYMDAIVSAAARDGASIDIESPLQLHMSGHIGTDGAAEDTGDEEADADDAAADEDQLVRYQLTYLVKARALVKKMAGFFFSSYRQTLQFSPMLVSLDDFQRLQNAVPGVAAANLAVTPSLSQQSSLAAAANDTMRALPMERIMVRLQPGLSQRDRDVIINGLRNYITDDLTTVFDTNDILAGAEIATDLILLFFYIVSIIAFVLCFFLLFLSFTANVRENAWEYGVLRAVGLTSAQVVRIYIYEALSLICSAVILGSCVGILIAVTLTLQFNLFAEMPFQFQFPTALFASVVVMAVAVAFVGSYLAARPLQRKAIALALKGN